MGCGVAGCGGKAQEFFVPEQAVQYGVDVQLKQFLGLQAVCQGGDVLVAAGGLLLCGGIGGEVVAA